MTLGRPLLKLRMGLETGQRESQGCVAAGLDCRQPDSHALKGGQGNRLPPLAGTLETKMENRSHDSSPRASFVSTDRDPFLCESAGGLLFGGRRVWGPHQCLRGFPQLRCSAAHDAPRPRLAAARRVSNSLVRNRKDLCARLFVICGAWLCEEPLPLGNAQSSLTQVSLRRLAQNLFRPLWRSKMMRT